MLYFLHIFGCARQYEQALLRSLTRKFLFFACPVWAGGNRPQPEKIKHRQKSQTFRLGLNLFRQAIAHTGQAVLIVLVSFNHRIYKTIHCGEPMDRHI